MNPAEVRERVLEYFKHCADSDMKPTVEGMAFAFDISRAMLQKYAQGAVQGIPQESVDWFRRGYDIVGTQLIDYLYNNKINVVAGIFMAKNNLGYEDKTVTYVQTDDSLGALQSEQELMKRISGSVPVLTGGETGSQNRTEQNDADLPIPVKGSEEQGSIAELDGRTPEALMDLLPEADTEE